MIPLKSKVIEHIFCEYYLRYFHLKKEPILNTMNIILIAVKSR